MAPAATLGNTGGARRQRPPFHGPFPGDLTAGARPRLRTSTTGSRSHFVRWTSSTFNPAATVPCERIKRDDRPDGPWAHASAGSAPHVLPEPLRRRVERTHTKPARIRDERPTPFDGANGLLSSRASQRRPTAHDFATSVRWGTPRPGVIIAAGHPWPSGWPEPNKRPTPLAIHPDPPPSTSGSPWPTADPHVIRRCRVRTWVAAVS